MFIYFSPPVLLLCTEKFFSSPLLEKKRNKLKRKKEKCEQGLSRPNRSRATNGLHTWEWPQQIWNKNKVVRKQEIGEVILWVVGGNEMSIGDRL